MNLPLFLPYRTLLASLVLFVTFETISLHAQTQQTIRFLFTSDLHGWLSSSDVYPKRKHTGLLHLRDDITKLRQNYSDLILIDAGDLLQGSPLTHFFQYVEKTGATADPFFKLFNSLGYDAVVVGNHDLAVNPGFENDYIPNSRFTWLSCNIYRKHKPVFAPYLIRMQNGIRIAILGFTTPGTEMWIGPEQLNGMEFRSLEKSVSFWIQWLKHHEQYDFLLGVFHAGLNPYRDDENAKLNRIQAVGRLRKILSDTDEFDLIVSGHDHRLDPRKSGQPVQYIGSTPVVSPGSLGESVLHIKVELEKRDRYWKPVSVDADVIAAKQDSLLAESYQKSLTIGYSTYISEKLPWEHIAASKEAASNCINRLLALSSDEPYLTGTLFPEVRVGALKNSKGSTINRLQLFRWIKYDNKAATITLSQRDIFLLTHPVASAGSFGPEYNRVLFAWLKSDIPVAAENEFFLNRNRFIRQYRIKIADYHFFGGGGIIPALFLENEPVSISSDFLREKLFLFFKTSRSLPQECSFFRYKPLVN